MKKIFAFIALIGILSISNFSAQNPDSSETPEAPELIETPEAPEENELDEDAGNEETSNAASDECGDDQAVSPYQDLKIKFIEGGPIFMAFVLIALILGLAMSIERIIYLNPSNWSLIFKFNLLIDLLFLSIFSKTRQD